MKQQTSRVLLLAAALFALAGCFGGEEEKDNGQPDPDSFTKVAPGFYTGDYSQVPEPPLGPGDGGLETELTLAADSSFRMFWLFDSAVVYDLRGKWSQKKDGLHFTERFDILRDRPDSLTRNFLDDTNEVVQVTPTSFVRKEWSPLQQRPLWIRYSKKTIPGIKAGKYEYTELDTVSGVTTKVAFNFAGDDLTYTIADSVVRMEIQAKWTQVGSVMEAYQNRRREWVDSLKAHTEWDTLQGEIISRVRAGDTTLELWIPSEPPFYAGEWVLYKKIE